MSIEIAIAHQAPILEVATTQLAVSIPDKSTIEVESAPITGIVQFIAVKGDKGADGITPDFGDPGTVADMLAALSGQITNSQLHSDLLASVNKIDVGPSSLEAQTALLAYADGQINAAVAEAANKISLNELAIAAAQSAITTLGSDLASLDGEVTGQASIIDSLSTRVTVAEHDIVTQAQSVSGLSTRIDNVESAQTAQAAIVNQNTVAISEIDGEITSTAEALATITAGTGGMAAAIQLKNQVIAGTTKALYAQNTVKLDVNGKISGYGLASTETSSIFEILADRFAVTNGLNSGVIPFIVDGANVYIHSAFIEDASITGAKITLATITNALIEDATIEGAKIALATIDTANIKDAAIKTAQIDDAQVTTLKIGLNQVTVPESYVGATVYHTTAAGTTTVCTLNATGFQNVKMHIQFSAGITFIPTTLPFDTQTGYVMVSVNINGTTVYSFGDSAWTEGMMSLAFDYTPPADGVAQIVVYAVGTVYSQSGRTLQCRFMYPTITAIGLKR